MNQKELNKMMEQGCELVLRHGAWRIVDDQGFCIKVPQKVAEAYVCKTPNLNRDSLFNKWQEQIETCYRLKLDIIKD
jgi:hypothetical protein